MKSILFISILVLQLAGCALIQPTPKITLKSADNVLKRTQRLVKQQRWGEAQVLLMQGVSQYPDNKAIEAALTKVRSKWYITKRRLKDWMLVYEIEGMLLKRPLLVSMTQSDPYDTKLKLRLKKLESRLDSKRKQLIFCAERQVDTELKLARRCVEAAKIIHLSIQVQNLLTKIEQQQTGIKSKIKVNEAETRNTLLMKARAHLRERSYYEAVKILEPIILQGKTDQDVNILMDEAITGRNLQVLQLISHGDRLYREEQIENALSIWKEAALLNPSQSDVKLRIARAQKVLNKLQEIRSGENKSPSINK